MHKNQHVFEEIEAILQKIQFGEVDIKLKVHRGSILSSTFYGKQSVRKRSNIESVGEIAKRLHGAFTQKQTANIKFEVDVRSGQVFEVIWDSSISRNYQES